MRLPVFAIFEVRPGCGFVVIYGVAENERNQSVRVMKFEAEMLLSDFVFVDNLLK